MDAERQSPPSRSVSSDPPSDAPGSWRVIPVEGGDRIEIRPRRDWLPPTSFVKRVQLALAIWMLALFLAFIASGISIGAFHPLPRWLELPWNGVNDFAIGTDGRIWLHVGLYGMLLSYDSEGRFLESRPGFTAGSVCLSTAADGRLFVLNAATVHTLSPDGVQLHRIEPDQEDSFTWRLGESGDPEHVRDSSSSSWAPNRPVRPGELLFGEECRRPRRHLVYELPGGGRVTRHFGPWLKITRPDGTTTSFTGPWYLLWAQFTFGWIPFIVLAIWSRRHAS